MKLSQDGSPEQDGDRYKVFIVAPTPFYYQVPLFRMLSAHPRIDLTVYYCSDEAFRGQDVQKKFGIDGRWGVEDELLGGYTHKFLKNHSPWPSYLKSVVGLMNFGITRELVLNRPHAVILMSWMNPTWWLAILTCITLRIPFFYLTDQNVQRDLTGPLWKRWVKRMVLGNLLFPLSSGFLCAGTENRLLYSYYGVPNHKLVPFAFSWGFDSMLEIAAHLKPQSKRLRDQLGLPQDSFALLYCGRLSPEKSPITLLRAYERVELPNKRLMFVGDGQLRGELEAYVADHKIGGVHFYGFQDRQNIPQFYAVADVLVLPSHQETWGIVINEALSFSLPVIVSDQVGAASDLVHHGQNGYVFPRGDIQALAATIEMLMQRSPEERLRMGSYSMDIISRWLTRDLSNSLEQYFDSVFSPRTKVAS